VKDAEAAIRAFGGRVKGEQISLWVCYGGNCRKVVVDLLAEVPDLHFMPTPFGGSLPVTTMKDAFIEVKNGASAGMTANQRWAYPLLNLRPVGLQVVPVGRNAQAAGLLRNQPMMQMLDLLYWKRP
jgi:hypothetical protein